MHHILNHKIVLTILQKTQLYLKYSKNYELLIYGCLKKVTIWTVLC